MFIKRLIQYFLSLFKFKLVRIKPNQPSRYGVNLNIGAGAYEIRNFISLDYLAGYYYRKESIYYRNNKLKFKRISYDMRNDKIPFDDNTVDNIYCSHVIEHIETEYVQKFFKEAFRVLKKQGVFRISVPDSDFLYKFMVLSKSADIEKNYFREMANHRINKPDYGLKMHYSKYSYKKLMEELRADGKFDEAHSDWHINNWDESRLNKLSKTAGFKYILKSTHKGSFSMDMQGEDMDLCHPEMSLYMDFIKQ
jgi:predicted SAM-dependent methyltransferase